MKSVLKWYFQTYKSDKSVFCDMNGKKALTFMDGKIN